MRGVGCWQPFRVLRLADYPVRVGGGGACEYKGRGGTAFEFSQRRGGHCMDKHGGINHGEHDGEGVGGKAGHGAPTGGGRPTPPPHARRPQIKNVTAVPAPWEAPLRPSNQGPSGRLPKRKEKQEGEGKQAAKGQALAMPQRFPLAPQGRGRRRVAGAQPPTVANGPRGGHNEKGGGAWGKAQTNKQNLRQEAGKSRGGIRGSELLSGPFRIFQEPDTQRGGSSAR